jgi:hypothetical protein
VAFALNLVVGLVLPRNADMYVSWSEAISRP